LGKFNHILAVLKKNPKNQCNSGLIIAQRFIADFFKMEMKWLANSKKQYLFCYYPGAQNWKAY